MKNNELYKRGWKWACDEIAKGTPIAEIEEKVDNAFDFNQFDRGALDALHELGN